MAKWLTVKEAGEYLGVSNRTIQRYIQQGKIKAKNASGKTTVNDNSLEAVKTGVDATVPRQSSDKRHDTTSPDTSPVSRSWTPPEGYILIDKDTLDTIKNQLNALTNELKEMRTTQQLLIEKGLNLRQLSDNTTPNDTTEPRQDKETVATVDAVTYIKDDNKTLDSDTTATQNDSQDTVAVVATDKPLIITWLEPYWLYIVALVLVFVLLYELAQNGYLPASWLEWLGLHPLA